GIEAQRARWREPFLDKGVGCRGRAFAAVPEGTRQKVVEHAAAKLARRGPIAGTADEMEAGPGLAGEMVAVECLVAGAQLPALRFEIGIVADEHGITLPADRRQAVEGLRRFLDQGEH